MIKTITVETLIAGKRWEVMEPENCALIPDECGVPRIDHDTFECRECGSRNETRDDANLCCEDNNA